MKTKVVIILILLVVCCGSNSSFSYKSDRDLTVYKPIGKMVHMGENWGYVFQVEGRKVIVGYKGDIAVIQ